MLYFGNSRKFKEEMLRIMDHGRESLSFLIIDASGISNIDYVGLKTLDELGKVAEERGIQLLLANVKGVVRKKVDAAGLVDDIVEATKAVEEVYRARCLSRVKKSASFTSRGGFDDGLIKGGG